MSVQIAVGARQADLQGCDDVEILRALDEELSFWVQGAQYTKAFRGYQDKDGKSVTWDGRRRLLTKGLSFPRGLVPRVERFFRTRGVGCQVRVPWVAPADPWDVESTLKKMDKEPYPYQREAAITLIGGERGVLRMPTGSGKTLVGLLVTAALGKRAIIYVIGSDLLYQWHELFTEALGMPVGIVGDGKCEIEDVTIASVWTVGQALGVKKALVDQDEKEKKVSHEKYPAIRAMLREAPVHLFDECHLAACKTIQEIAKAIRPDHVYGMSASPWRDDGADLLVESMLGGKVVDVPAQRLIEQGYLAEPLIRFIPVPTQSVPKLYPSVYKKYVVENEVRNDLVAEGAVRLVEQGFQTLVLFHSLAHGAELEQRIGARIPCEKLSGKDSSDRRKAVKEAVGEGKVNCVLASKIFDTGVDIPSLSGLVTAGAGKSTVRALQRVGRVIRRYPGKERAIVFDFKDDAKFLRDHSEVRKRCYQEEFKVEWPESQEKR